MGKKEFSLESKVLALNKKIEEDKKQLDKDVGELTALTLELQADRIKKDPVD